MGYKMQRWESPCEKEDIMLSFPHYHNSTHVAHVPVQRISERLVRRDKIRCISTQPWSRRAPSTADPFGFDSSDTVHLEISQIAPPLLCWRICWQLTAVEPTPSLLAPSDEAKKLDQPGGPMDPEPQPKLGPNPPESLESAGAHVAARPMWPRDFKCTIATKYHWHFS